MRRATGAKLHRDGEAIRIPSLGKQLARFLRVVGEQLLDRSGHLFEGLIVVAPIRMLRIRHQLGMTTIEKLDDLGLIHRQVHRAAHSQVIERFLIDAQHDELAGRGKPSIPFQFRRRLLQMIDRDPAHGFENVELAGPQSGQIGRFILDDSVRNVVDEWNVVGDPVDFFLIPINGVLAITLGIAVDVAGQLKRTRTGDVAPVLRVDVGKFPRTDTRVVAVAEPISPLGIELVEMKDHRVIVASLEPFDMIEIGRNAPGALIDVVEAEQHVVRHEFSSAHDPRFVGKHNTAAQMHHQRQRVFPLPRLGELATPGFARQIRLRDERELTALANALFEVSGEQLLANRPSVMIAFPCPVGRVP